MLPPTIRLIATDMDGTLTCEGKFSSRLLHELEQLAAAQIPVVIVTGRSAGWVESVAHYLPVAGAIAENGGLFYTANAAQHELLVPLPSFEAHRAKLAHMFAELQQRFPHLVESSDNRFRITDWTFDVTDLSVEDLNWMNDHCQQLGWGFTYSTVQCHIRPLAQDKAIALQHVLHRYYPDLTSQQVVTVGDSPNDQSLFNPEMFPYSVGVANVRHYLAQLSFAPAHITAAAEVDGFCEVMQQVLAQ
ncbi:HAD family hydrolase [Leptolyngbya sp. AN02str]|uniref:HAD family hydrolase n=1 Tax=Leptolyngbya sp. AN02str TaxID=3423363 RepID=UPI003D312FDB